MANDFSTFMNTVAARFSDMTAYLQPHAAFLSATTMNPIPQEFKQFNDIVKLNIGAVGGSVVNHATTAVTTADVTTSATNIQLNNIPTKTFKIGTYEASRLADSPGLLDETFKIVMTQMIEYLNGQIASLFTTANFNTAGNIAGTGTGAAADVVSHADVSAMWGTLTARKVPVTDRGNTFIVTHPYIYAKWLDDADFTKATSIGDEYASQMRTNGNLFPLNGVLPLFDSQAIVTGTSPNLGYTTAMFHRRATITQFAIPQPPADGRAFRYTNVMGIPFLIVPFYDTNLGSTGGASNQFTISTLYNTIPFRVDHGVIHTTPTT